MPRQQLPVYSPIRASALASGLRSAIRRNGAHHASIANLMAGKLGARRVILTDTGTSALVLALRATVGERGGVAFPGYACIDLTAAALYANVKVHLYDIDPATLSPDLDSVARVLRQGVAAVVVAHLYGFPGDVPGVTELARMYGASVIEDAAQGSGGVLRKASLGSFGALTVLSFGRGKGITGGRGGALLAITPDMANRLDSIAPLGQTPAGWRDLAIATTQCVLGRPTLYSIPAAIPWLRLGEMVFHPAHEPHGLSAAAAAVVDAVLPAAEREALVRRRNAERLMTAARDADGLALIHPVSGGTSGYLRFPVRDLRQRVEARRLGIVRGYPRPLIEQEELRSCLSPNEVAPTGAMELSRSLFTLPVHSLVSRRDLNHLAAWLRSPTGLFPRDLRMSE